MIVELLYLAVQKMDEDDWVDLDAGKRWLVSLMTRRRSWLVRKQWIILFRSGEENGRIMRALRRCRVSVRRGGGCGLMNQGRSQGANWQGDRGRPWWGEYTLAVEPALELDEVLQKGSPVELGAHVRNLQQPFQAISKVSTRTKKQLLKHN